MYSRIEQRVLRRSMSNVVMRDENMYQRIGMRESSSAVQENIAVELLGRGVTHRNFPTALYLTGFKLQQSQSCIPPKKSPLAPKFLVIICCAQSICFKLPAA